MTHMPSSRIGIHTNIKSTGPLKGEFGILALDLYLRTGSHKFVFASSNNLNHQPASPEHLSQNYTIDIVPYGIKKKPIIIIAGCVAQAENEEMLKREPYIDMVVGPQSYHKLNSLLKNFEIIQT